jgi:hypothetical protein
MQRQRLQEPGPPAPGESQFITQLRTWGRDVVRALLHSNVHGDGRRIAVAKLAGGGVCVSFLEDPPPQLGFYAYWRRGSNLGSSAQSLVVRAGNIRTSLGTVAIAQQTISPPGSGDRYFWVQVDFNYSAGSVSGSWQSGTSFPTYAQDTDSDGSYDRINVPICWIDEEQTGSWRVYQVQSGDVLLEPIGDSVALRDVCVDVSYSTGTGILQKRMVTLQVVKGIMTVWGTSTLVDVFTAMLCPTTTTTTTTT